MAGIGTLLTTLGWLWLIFAFAGPAFGLDRLPFLPAIALLFGGRLLKAQARRSAREGEGDLSDLSASSQPAGTSSLPAPSPMPPPTRSERRSSPIGRDTAAERDAEARASGAYAEALRAAAEDVLEEVAETQDEMLAEPGSDQMSTGLSSAEMVARARRRWDRKP